jgi:hypothetical protein
MHSRQLHLVLYPGSCTYHLHYHLLEPSVTISTELWWPLGPESDYLLIRSSAELRPQPGLGSGLQWDQEVGRNWDLYGWVAGLDCYPQY